MAGSSTGNTTWAIREADVGRLVVELRGDLEKADANALGFDLRERMAAASPGTYEIVFDLNELRRCTIDARTVLSELQRYLGGIARRTAYVTNRPLFRGLALWVCHTAPDSNARTFPSLGHASGWLSSEEPREQALEARARRWIGRIRGLTFTANTNGATP